MDGVSLTVNAVDGGQFRVQIIAHTLRYTTLGDYRAGQRVNIEVDIVAHYIHTGFLRRTAPSAPSAKLCLSSNRSSCILYAYGARYWLLCRAYS